MNLRATGKLRIDLRGLDNEGQYRAIGSLSLAPAGAEVDVDRPPPCGTVARLQDWASHCRFVIVARECARIGLLHRVIVRQMWLTPKLGVRHKWPNECARKYALPARTSAPSSGRVNRRQRERQ